MKKLFQANTCKKITVAMVISDRIDFKPKIVTRDKDGNYIVIEVLIHQQNMTVIKVLW